MDRLRRRLLLQTRWLLVLQVHYMNAKYKELKDGDCDHFSGGDYNTAECGCDGGDCTGKADPDCRVPYPEKIGDG